MYTCTIEIHVSMIIFQFTLYLFLPQSVYSKRPNLKPIIAASYVKEAKAKVRERDSPLCTMYMCTDVYM